MSLDLPARCPHCGVEHPPSSGRFCDSCGRSVVQFVKRSSDDDATSAGKPKLDELGRIVCPSCGTPSRPPICLSCYTRLPSIDD